jgi:hypothetical protein
MSQRRQRTIYVSLNPEPADVEAAIEVLADFFMAKAIDNLSKRHPRRRNDGGGKEE